MLRRQLDLWVSSSDERAEHTFEGLWPMVGIESHRNVEGHAGGDRK